MKRTYYLLIVGMFICPLLSYADSTRLPSNTFFNYELPSPNWTVSIDPPQLAIDAMYVDLVHSKEKKGEAYDPEKLKAMAVKFLKTNNLYIFNEKTEAYLMVSIAPYTQKEGIPKKKAIRKSAEWAIEAIAEHAEVDDLSPYSSSLDFIEIKGMQHAAMIDTNYPLFGAPHHFIGIIGYSHPYWVFLYYNDKLKDDSDLVEMRQLLESIRFDTL